MKIMVIDKGQFDVKLFNISEPVKISIKHRGSFWGLIYRATETFIEVIYMSRGPYRAAIHRICVGEVVSGRTTLEVLK